MPVTLQEAKQALGMHGLKWVCCECLTLNGPSQMFCVNCGKQRWFQLGLTLPVAEAAAAVINAEGYGA